mgnify:CR=1 FL=1
MDWRKLITLKHLRMLQAISESGSLANAADKLNLSPSAITVQLSQLEQYLDVRILDRGPNGRISMSNVGIELLSLFRQMDAQIDRSFNRVELLKLGKSGYVKLGAVSTAQYFCPWIIAKAKKYLPDITVDLLVGNRNEIIRSLEDGKVDLAITGRPPRQPLVHAEILGDNPHILILPPNHHLLELGEKLQDASTKQINHLLQNETFLVREEGSGTRILLERFLDTIGKGREFKRKEFSSNETIKQGVMAALGIALISASTVTNEIKDGGLKTLKIPNLPIVRQWFLVNLLDSNLSPAVVTFKDFLFHHKRDLIPN